MSKDVQNVEELDWRNLGGWGSDEKLREKLTARLTVKLRVLNGRIDPNFWTSKNATHEGATTAVSKCVELNSRLSSEVSNCKIY